MKMVLAPTNPMELQAGSYTSVMFLAMSHASKDMATSDEQYVSLQTLSVLDVSLDFTKGLRCMGQDQVSNSRKKKLRHSVPALQSVIRVVWDMSEMQVVSKFLLDKPFIYGSGASPLANSSILQDLLQRARRLNPIIQGYKTTAEIRQGSSGLPLLATDAAAGILGQQQHWGPLHDVYKQTQENAMYLAVHNRPVEACAFPADAIIGGHHRLPAFCGDKLKGCPSACALISVICTAQRGAALTHNLRPVALDIAMSQMHTATATIGWPDDV